MGKIMELLQILHFGNKLILITEYSFRRMKNTCSMSIFVRFSLLKTVGSTFVDVLAVYCVNRAILSECWKQ